MDLGKILDTPMDGVEAPGLEHKEIKNDLWLPVPMTTQQKYLADQVVSLHYSDILKLFETNMPVMPESLNTLYENSQLVCSHPYLLLDRDMPRNLLLKDVPALLARESGKFKVLGDLLDMVREEKIHVALVARPKAFDLLEAFIMGRFVNYKRHCGECLRDPGEEDEDYSTVHLIPSTQLDSRYKDDHKFDLVIAFDQTFKDTDAHIEALRTNKREDLAPVIRLIPQNSVEHISLKFKQEETERGFLRHVLAAVVVLRDRVGEIPSQVANLYDKQLAVVGEWFHNKTGWPMPELPHVAIYNSSDVERSLLTEPEESETPASDGPVRTFYETKRLKRDVVEEPPSDKLTHELLAKMNRLMHDNELKAAELESFRLNASTRQAAHEALTEEMADRVDEIDGLKTRMAIAERRADRKANEVTRAQEQLEEVAKQLQESKDLFQQTPDQARLLRQEERIRELETELANAEKRLESRAVENDYTRAEYQKASSAAADASATIDRLTQENAELRGRVDGYMVQLREKSFDAERLNKDDQIKELQLKYDNLQEQMRRMLENQNKDKTRSRFSSRASSMSRTMSPSQLVK